MEPKQRSEKGQRRECAHHDRDRVSGQGKLWRPRDFPLQVDPFLMADLTLHPTVDQLSPQKGKGAKQSEQDHM